ncbi:hypothetical protein SAMN05421504_101207 [Amycolatopsis xylanica]|uniref:Uncharacterized protein n=1 Tax=Amycolatopsis xylanica TaxID=589385 RepID=A0A1H2SFD5_9PSEU|nr:hypothetical protein [Amycolatopsis xylanica]SDW30403.1 hypothetical protein SAMN05421504_101207 [Amycolatopsis xylanica]
MSAFVIEFNEADLVEAADFTSAGVAQVSSPEVRAQAQYPDPNH